MERLKELRTRSRMTQSELAQQLGTTQQTIARWEGGQTDIPVAHLKDIAVLFGKSVDDLLGIKRLPQQRKAAAVTRSTQGAPFGTFKVVFPFGVREYPIDENENERLRNAFDALGLNQDHGPWFDFTALDNKLVFLNLGSIKALELVTDDEEEAPFHASAETYRSLTADTPADEIGPLIAKERKEVVARLAPDERDERKALEQARSKLKSLQVTFSDGTDEDFFMSEAAATSIQVLQNSGMVGRNALLAVDEEGEYGLKVVNLSSVAAIEVPLEAYLQKLSDDAAD